jgi:hypothetical protein
MKILVCATLRDMVSHPNWGTTSPLKCFLMRCRQLLKIPEISGISIYENDSKDGTREELSKFAADDPRITYFHEDLGRPLYRSFPASKSDERLSLFAEMRMKPLKALTDEDWVLYIEPDILWELPLIDLLLHGESGDIRTALSFSNPYDMTSFYDTLATIDLNGEHFRTAWPPVSSPLLSEKIIRGIPFEVGSSWSGVVLIRSEIFHKVSFTFESGRSEADTFCTDARKLGYRVFIYPALRYSVVHPLADRAFDESRGVVR